MKTKYTKANYKNPTQLLKAHDCETLREYAREAYDRTRCGVWTAFIAVNDVVIPSDDLPDYANSKVGSSAFIKGIQHGTIVEGSDAEFEADALYFPFSDKQLAETWDYLEELASEEWEKANA